MTPKQISFCQAYLTNGFRAGHAAREAGYKFNSDQGYMTYGSKLLTKPQIRDYLEKKAKSVSAKTELTVQKILDDLELAKRIALGKEDPQTGEYPKADLTPYIKATELQGKYLKMFTDKVEVQIDSHTELMKLIKMRLGHEVE